MCKGRGTGGTSALSLERQGCGEKQRPDYQLPPDCTTKISELRVRTGEGGGQKGRGLREEGDGAGSQGEWLQQPPVPVQTHPGSTRTQTPSELDSHEDSCTWPEGLRDPCKHACTHAPMHRDTQTYNSRALRNTQAHVRPHAPCVVSEYCQRLGQRGRQRVTCPQMGLVHSAFPPG